MKNTPVKRIKRRAILRLELSAHLLLLGLFSGMVLDYWTVPGVPALEQMFEDARINIGLSREVDERIVIVDIDEASLSRFGQWPWSRALLAQLVEKLFDDYQVRVLGLDMVLAEPTSSRLPYLRELEKLGYIQWQTSAQTLAQIQPEDDALAAAIRGRNLVAGFVFKSDAASTLNQLPEPLASYSPDVSATLAIPKPKGYTANIAKISEAARTQGFFDNPVVDSDGVYRRAALIQLYNGAVYPSLALSVARAALSDEDLLPVYIPPPEPLAGQLMLEYLQIGRSLIPLSENSTVRIPYRYRQGYAYVSAADVLLSQLPEDRLRDRIVLLGTTAPGLKDIRNTPVAAQMPGVEVHASLISGILDQQIAYQPSWRLPLELGILLTTAILLWWLYRRRQPWISMLSTLAWLLLGVLINVWVWKQGFLVALAPFVLMTLAMYLLNSSWELLVENYNKRRITRLFGQYVPPELADDLADYSPTNLLGGQSRELTVLFSDVRGFTSLSENLSPQQLTDLMNRLLTPLTNIIHRQRGTIDKYMGDAIMAFWGAPVPLPDHAHLAVEAALKMQNALHSLRTELADFNVGELGMGIGVHTGPMSVGNMGSEFRMAYTVMGDAVNLGSRLEALTRQYGVDVLVSGQTCSAAPEFWYLPVDRVRVKGKNEPVDIFTPLAPKAEPEPLIMAPMKRAIEAYRAQRWPEATEAFREVYQQSPQMSEICDVYLKRIVQMRILALPSDWDGVFTHETK